MAALEFTLPPEDVTRLLRQPALRGRGRPVATNLTWYDTADGALAADQLSLCESKGMWRIEQAGPRPGQAGPPGTPMSLVAEASDRAVLGKLPEPLMPVAGFRGTRRSTVAEAGQDASVSVLEGTMRGLAQEAACCRVVLQGDPVRLIQLSAELADAVRLDVPRWSLATEAAAFARGFPPPDRRSGAPEVPPGMPLGDAVALVVGHLTDVILAGVPAAAAGATPEPVHVMRVAVRRLRSALSIFRRVTDGPALQALKPQLQELGAVLGQARDWDVFLAGTGRAVAAALPEDRRIAAMLAVAGKRREAAYAGLRRNFASPGFRQLSIALVQFAALRPWQAEDDAERAAALAGDAAPFAAALLARRHKRMLQAGADIALVATPELHELRKQGKQLRYAAEFFAPCHGRRSTRRFLRAVSRLQEALGHLNDGAAAAALMGELRGGVDAHFADGAVQGFAAACSGDVRTSIAKAWSKFRRVEPPWA